MKYFFIVSYFLFIVSWQPAARSGAVGRKLGIKDSEVQEG